MNALNLDHVGIAVHDLDAAAEQFRRLGFQLTPRGYHTLPAKADGERPRVGSGNNCAMLERGYIELIGIVDPSYLGRLRDDLARYEGLHIVAFGTRDSEATIQALRARAGRGCGSSSGRSSTQERRRSRASRSSISAMSSRRFTPSQFGMSLPMHSGSRNCSGIRTARRVSNP